MNKERKIVLPIVVVIVFEMDKIKRRCTDYIFLILASTSVEFIEAAAKKAKIFKKKKKKKYFRSILYSYGDYDSITTASVIMIVKLMRVEQIATEVVTYFEYDGGAQLRMQILADGHNNPTNVGKEAAGCDALTAKTGNVCSPSKKTFCIRIEPM